MGEVVAGSVVIATMPRQSKVTDLQTYGLVDSTSHAHRGLRGVKYIQLELKQVEHFEHDDDNDNDSDDVEDVSVHGSWITRRYPRRQAI